MYCIILCISIYVLTPKYTSQCNDLNCACMGADSSDDQLADEDMQGLFPVQAPYTGCKEVPSRGQLTVLRSMWGAHHKDPFRACPHPCGDYLLHSHPTKSNTSRTSHYHTRVQRLISAFTPNMAAMATIGSDSDRVCIRSTM